MGYAYLGRVINCCPHSEVEEVLSEKALYQAATCETQALYYYTCKKCEKVLKDPTRTFKSGVPASHSYKNITSGGNYNKHDECSVCGYVLTDHGNNLTGTMTVEPTCTTAGLKTWSCTCGHSYTENVAATGHSYSTGTQAGTEGLTITAATCTTPKIYTRTCLNGCGTSTREESTTELALNHSLAYTIKDGKECCYCQRNSCNHFGEYDYNITTEIKTKPTCTSIGYGMFTCDPNGIFAGYTSPTSYTIAIDPNNHVGSTTGGTDADHCLKCNACNEYIYDGHNLVTDKGTKDIHAYCTRCSYKQGANFHKYSSETIVSATCTTAGLEKYTCSCGYSYEQDISALGHTWNGETCSVCNETCKHNFKEDPDNSKKHICTICGTSAYHTFQHPQVTGEGNVQVVCTVCNLQYSHNIMIYHQVAANCETKTDGYIQYICSTCSNDYNTNDILYTKVLSYKDAHDFDMPPIHDPLGYCSYRQCSHCNELKIDQAEHTWEVISDSNAHSRCSTCLSDCTNILQADENKHYCANCGWEANHDFNDTASSEVCQTCKVCGYKTEHPEFAIEHEDPTCEANGYTITRCEICHYQDNQLIDRLGHEMEELTEGGDYYAHAECIREGCDYVTSDSPYEHSYTRKVTPVTCEQDGKDTYTCSCGYSYDEPTDKAFGHNLILEYINDEWYCYCTNDYCDAKNVKINVTNQVDYEGSAPSCTQGAIMLLPQIDYGNRTYQRITTTVPALGHGNCTHVYDEQYKNWTYVCTVCGSDDVPGTHNITKASSKVISPATCEKNGTTEYTCSCGFIWQEDDITALGHDLALKQDGNGNWYCYCTRGKDVCEEDCRELPIAVNYNPPATCTNEGIVEVAEIFSYGNATYTGGNLTTTVPALGHAECTHVYDEKNNNWSYECIICGEDDIPDAHNLEKASSKIIKEATCEQKGITQYTCKCGFTWEEDDIPALSHNLEFRYDAEADCGYCRCLNGEACDKKGAEVAMEVNVEIPADCETEGQALITNLTYGKDVYNGSAGLSIKIPALGHNFGHDPEADWIYQCLRCKTDELPEGSANHITYNQAEEESCFEEGYRGIYCDDCQKWLEYTSIPAYGSHQGSLVPAENPDEGTCMVYSCCGASYSSGHNFEAIDIKDNTGHQQKCINCGYIAKNLVPHNYESITKDATCTENGSYKEQCECGYIAVNEVIEAKGHNFEVVASGTKILHAICSRCSVINDNHSYTSEVTKAPTCESTGTEEYTCECGYHYTEDIDEKGHNLVLESDDTGTYVRCTRNNCDQAGAKDYELTYESYILPTCTTDGKEYLNNSAKYGATAAQALNAYRSISATGHSNTGNLPSVTVNGDQHYFTCDNCNKVIYEDHDWEDGVCTICELACGHSNPDWSNWQQGVQEKAASCTEDGYFKATCAVCGKYVDKIYSALGHTMVGGSEASCYVNHTHDCSSYCHKIKCTRCDQTYETINHAWSDTGHCNNYGCQATHNWLEYDATEYRCNLCGAICKHEQKVINSVSHTWKCNTCGAVGQL